MRLTMEWRQRRKLPAPCTEDVTHVGNMITLFTWVSTPAGGKPMVPMVPLMAPLFALYINAVPLEPLVPLESTHIHEG
jgi:hypothetical protein